MLGNRLAQTLGVQPGDRVRVEFLEGRQRVHDILVGAVYDEPMGRSAFIAERELRMATGDGPQTSLIALRIARDQQAELIAALKNFPPSPACSTSTRSSRIYAPTLNVISSYSPAC